MTNRLKAIRITFEIVEALSELDGAGVSELAYAIDRPVSTVHDHLKSLEELEYLVQHESEYHVGTKFLEIGQRELHQKRFYKIAKPEIVQLAEETGEFAGLMIEEHNLGVMLHSHKGDNAVDIRSFPGERMPLHSLAAGKVILAHLPEERRAEIIDKNELPAITEETITDPSTLREELLIIRERWFALDQGERIEDVRTLAAPIFDEVGAIVASIAIAVPIHRMDENEFIESMSNPVMRTAIIGGANLKYADA
ncbi:IclR family transcriptional regulator [Natrinema halophilum]|uniref:IclR family transcriptional regulator n=1 Tax=Natrinema halophilum TaxID=1699371 RepID=UPI001F1C5985|nr:IclR family transcriptional regulator [Natrinema halophilum]UHQ96200.1 IclR family transcriptional regulator [Natrinema halophilum]